MKVLCISAFLRSACMMLCLLCKCFERVVCLTMRNVCVYDDEERSSIQDSRTWVEA